MARKIFITSNDKERLLRIIRQEKEFGSAKNKSFLRDLEQELLRAEVLPSDQIPNDVITMNSKITLVDLETKEETVYTLVYPEEADILEDKISVLAPIGTAILGFRQGDIIDWKVPDGVAQLQVKEILYQPEASGNYEL